MNAARRWKHFSIVVSVAFIVSLGANVAQDQADRAEDRRERAEEDCRDRLIAAVSDASIGRDLADADLNLANGRANAADADLTLAIGAEVGVPTPPGAPVPTLADALADVSAAGAEIVLATEQLRTAEEALTAANDARQTFERNPAGGC